MFPLFSACPILTKCLLPQKLKIAQNLHTAFVFCAMRPKCQQTAILQESKMAGKHNLHVQNET